MPERDVMLVRQQVLADFGEFALRSEDVDEVLTEACRLVGAALGTHRAKVLEIQDGGREVLVRAGVGWRRDIVGNLRLPMSEESSETFSIKARAPVVTHDIKAETRFDVPRFLKEAGVVAFVNVPILVPGARAYGILQVDSITPRAFDDGDIQFLRTYATILGPVIDRLLLREERRIIETERSVDLAAMEELQRISAELIGEHEPRILYQRIVAAAAVLLQADAATIQTLDTDTWQLGLLASTGSDPHLTGSWHPMLTDAASLYGRALQAGSRVTIPDIELIDADRRAVEACRHSGMRSFQVTPLRAHDGRTVGMLSTYWHEPRERTPAEYRYFDVLARLSADLIERVRATDRLRESEARLAAAFESVPVGVAAIDLSGATIIDNAEYRRFLPTGRIPSRNAAGAWRWRAWDRRGRPVAPQDFPSARALRGEAVVPGIEMLYTDDEGQEIWTSVATTPTRGERGQVTGAVTAISDINASKRSAEELRLSEERMRHFGEASQDVLWIRNAQDLQWEYLTPAFEAIYGLGRAEALRGDNMAGWAELIVPEDRERAIDDVRRVRDGEWVTFEYRIRRPSDGAVRWLRNTDFPIKDAAGRVAHIGSIGHDITEIKQTEQALAAAVLRQRALIEGMPQLVWRAVDGGEWTWASPQWTTYTGQPELESHGQGWLKSVHPDDRVIAQDAWADAIDQGGFDVEYRLRRKSDGAYRWFRTRAAPVRDDHGVIIEWLGTCTDVDDLRLLQGRQEVLVAELQHRVRNMLTVIRSVFRQTMESGRDLDEVSGHFVGRLDALARTQIIVTRTADGKVDLGDLIRDELLSVAANEGPKVRIDGPNVSLSSKSAESLGLAIHELTTNALKYGALKVADANLTISWNIDVDHRSDRFLTIIWIEQGVPAIATRPVRQGFGTELIEEALPYRLGAETKLEFRGGGIRCSIRIPLSDHD